MIEFLIGAGIGTILVLAIFAIGEAMGRYK